MALDGKTPAQGAGLVVDGKDKWLALLKAAAHSNKTLKTP
jgi:hypothetical protein